MNQDNDARSLMRSFSFGLLISLTFSAQASQNPRSVLDLKLFYQRNCLKCHGLDGSATSPEGKRLKGRDFTSAKEMEGTTDEGLARTIRKGIFFGKVMPAFKYDLSEEDARLMVREVVRKSVKGQPIAPQVDTPLIERPPVKPEGQRP